MDAETSNMALYHKFTMVNMGAEGVIFKAWGGATFKLYLCSYSSSTWSWTETTVTIDNPGSVAYTGAQETTTTTWDSTAYTSTTLV